MEKYLRLHKLGLYIKSLVWKYKLAEMKENLLKMKNNLRILKKKKVKL